MADQEPEPSPETVLKATQYIRQAIGRPLATIAVMLGDDFQVTLIARHVKDPSATLVLSTEKHRSLDGVLDLVTASLQALKTGKLFEAGEGWTRHTTNQDPT